MKKKYRYLFILALNSIFFSAQVGVNTNNPQGVFNIDTKKDNPTTGAPTVAQQANDVAVDANGSVGIGTTVPTNKLHVIGAAPLRLEGVGNGDSGTDALLTVDNTGVVKKIGTLGSLSIPAPSVFQLETDMLEFLDGAGAGGSSIIPMTMLKNSIPGMTYNPANSVITFPTGTYQFMFVYEGAHSNTGCTISSYFFDFPAAGGANTRIHNTAAHREGYQSNHGGAVNYVTTITTANRAWQIRMGRGTSGNCSGPGMQLTKYSTQLLVFRIGEAN